MCFPTDDCRSTTLSENCSSTFRRLTSGSGRASVSLLRGLCLRPSFLRHGRYVIFQMAEVAIPRDLFADILRRIDRLRPTRTPA